MNLIVEKNIEINCSRRVGYRADSAQIMLDIVDHFKKT